MKTFFKKSIALALTLLMLITSIPVMNLAGVNLGFTAEAATYKVGDIVKFGSYPQSRVTDSATITALNNKAPAWSNWTSYGYYTGTSDYSTIKQGDWMRYTDVTHNGDKYRGVKFTQYRPFSTYSTSYYTYSQQDNNGYYTNTVYWFKFEPIDWRVLDPATGLVMSETIIDSQPYSNTIYVKSAYFNDSSYTNYANDYETSSIRKWLNNDFYNAAFTDSEKKEINITTLNNDGVHTSLGITGYEKFDSNSTNDKIFLLSYNEVRNSNFGFDSDQYKYAEARQAQGSDYAKSQGLYVNRVSGSTYNNNSNWLLRSPGDDSNYCCTVGSGGAAGSDGFVDYSQNGVRPALCLSRVSGISPNNPNNYKVGDIVQFGSYPQSKVTESAIITALNSKAPAWDTWTSYGYYSGTGDYGTMKPGDWMRYTDVTYNGDKYRGVMFTQYRPTYTYYHSSLANTYQVDNGYKSNTVYWFKFEPIDWRVLDPTTGLVMCETIIDAQPYSNTIYINSSVSEHRYTCFNDSSYKNYANDYETSSIRKWLNNDFYNTAFTDSEKKEINTTTLNNDGYYTSVGTTGYEVFDSNSTNDKIFLLSYNEAKNSNFGFNSNAVADDKARFAQGSDYAQSQGLYVHRISGTTYNNNSYWSLRSSHTVSHCYSEVDIYGNLGSHSVQCVDEGVRPALKCNLDKIIAADDTVPDSENSEEIKAYINEHVNFVNSNNYNNITTNASFYKQIWQYEEGSRNFTRYAAWDIIGDVGKFIALDFYGILKTDNPYDIILVDVFRDFVDREESSFASTVEIAGKATFTTLNVVNDFLAIFKTSGAWNTELEGAATAYLKKLNTEWLKGVIFTEETFDLKDYDESLYNGLQGVLSKISKSGNLKNSLNKGFGGLKNISTIADYISTGGDIVWKLFDAYQKYLIAQALCKTNAEILAAIEMISEFNMPNKASNLLKDALDPYWDVFTCDDFYASISKVLAEDGIWGSGTNAIYSLLVKDALKDIVYTALGKVCGFSFWTLSATYNLTYMCLDYLSGLGKQSEMHTLLNAAALFEKPLLSLVNSKAIELKNNKNLDSAVRFDALYVILQSLEGLCYKSMNTYISAFKQEYLLNYAIKTSIANNFFYSMIKGIQLNEDISACDSAIEVMVYLENEWRNMNCHNKKYTSSIINSVKCPTDIYVYDSNGNLALSIIDNKVTLCADEITAFVDGDEKIFVTPDTQKYTVKIKAIDNGVMNVSEARFKNMQYLGSESFKNVSITNNRTYTLDTEKNILERDDGVIIHQNGDIDGCSCKCHENGFLAKFIWKITLFFNKILKKNKECACGIYHY